MSDLYKLLTDALAPDASVRKAAELRLEQAAVADFNQYCAALVDVLSAEHSGVSESVVVIAGLMLKNSISARAPTTDALLRERWVNNLTDDVKNTIKRKLLVSVLSPAASSHVQRSTCQVIAKIARIEIPQNGWPEMFAMVQEGGNSAAVASRIVSHLLLEYFTEDTQILCDELNRDLLLDEHKTFVLSHLIKGMVDPNPDVKLQALRGFYHAVLFADKFMRIEGDRRQLFNLVGGCISKQRNDVELAAWAVLVQMANEYYEYFHEYLPAIAPITYQKIRSRNSEDSNVSTSAIEFWSTLCDEEIMITNDQSHRQMQYYIQNNKDDLLPLLFEATVKTDNDEDDYDEDEWTSAMAAGTCVSLCAQVLKDHILAIALKFIEENFGSSQWQRRDAAIYVYGGILDGPSTRNFKPLLKTSFPMLVKALMDPSVGVRDTTAWTIGTAAKCHIEAFKEYIDRPAPDGLVDILLGKWNDKPRVVKNVCYALYEIFDNFHESDGNNLANRNFVHAADVLVHIAKRPDAAESQMREAAYHTLYMLVAKATMDQNVENAMNVLLSEFTKWIDETRKYPFTEEVGAIQAPMVGVINALLERLINHSMSVESAPIIVRSLIGVLDHGSETSGNIITKWSPAAEEIMLTFMTLANGLGEHFAPIMEMIRPVLLAALMAKNEEPRLCGLAIECLGAAALALDYGLHAYTDMFATPLFSILKDTSTSINLKPKAITALSDFALAVPKQFFQHLPELLDVLGQASSALASQGPPESEEWIDYIRELRDAALSAYSSCIYCIGECDANNGGSQLLEQKASKILEFVQLVLRDTQVSTDKNVQNAVRLMRDLVKVFKKDVVTHIRTTPLLTMLKDRSASCTSEEVRVEFSLLEQVIQAFPAA